MGLNEVQSKIGINFKNPDLLKTALTHSTYKHDHPEEGCSNDRLAWLGDAVLYYVVTEELLKKLKTQDTDQLTEKRKEFIEKHVLAQKAKELQLDQLLLLGKGEEKRKGRNNIKNLHTAYEALLGAIYKDKGMDVAQEYIINSYMKVRENKNW